MTAQFNMEHFAKSSHDWRQTGFQQEPSKGYQVSSTESTCFGIYNLKPELKPMHVIPHAPVQLVIVLLDDLLDADDIVAVCEDGKICRFYFPKFKERSRFKGLVKAEAEENKVRTFTSSHHSPSFPAKESGYKLTSLPEIFESALPNCACQIFRREAFNGKISPCEILV